MIELNYVKIKKAVFLYMFLPLWSFIALYLRSLLGGIFLIILLVFSVINIEIRQEKMRKRKIIQLHFPKDESKDIIQIKIKYLIIFIVVAVVWSFLGGQGNLYYQSSDWGCRNAIYRDIIYREWPVIYPDYNKALVYYIGYWLPAASITKIIGFIVPDIYLSETAFTIGNIFLWIWTSMGVFLTELLLLTYAKPRLRYRQLLVPIILVFFSGMDIIGTMRSIIVEGKQFEIAHLEWWCYLQFSSLTTCLFWVFNQTIVPWLAILCVLQEEKLCNYVFIGICAFAAGPIPMVGIAVYMLLNGLYKGIDSIANNNMKEFLKQVFSPVNCLAVFILPIFLLYYKSNQALNNGIAGTAFGVFSVFKLATITDEYIKNVILLLVFDVGIYLLLLYENYKNDIFFYITVITTIIAPFIQIGGSYDFTMRFSIPTVMVMAAMCLKYLVNYDTNKVTDKKSKYIFVILCVCLLIGSMTPITEFFRGYNTMLQTGKIVNVCDDIKTFNQDIPANNFTAHDYKNSAFFKVFLPDK